MTKDEIIENLAKLYDAYDPEGLDAADFIDQAHATFELYLAARNLMEK